MSFRPLYDRVLIKRVEAEQTTASGLIIPDAAKEKPLEGKIIAVGNGRVSADGSVQALTVEAGQRILFGKYTGDEVKLDGVEHVILREEDILAIIDRN